MIEISYKKIRAVLAPELGGTILRFTVDGRDILRPASSFVDVDRDPREAAYYPCVPWFGRLAGGLDHGGQHYDLEPTLPACDPHHALHGVGWINPWRVTAQTDVMADCEFAYVPKPGGFPFGFLARQTFSLGDDGLSIRLSLTNTDSTAIPAGLGMHPFFPRTRETQLQFLATRCWIPPGENTRGREEAISAALGFASPRALPAETTDCSFIGWPGDASFRGSDGITSLESDAPILHLYAPQDQNFFCLEPITHLPGEFGQMILVPGETLSQRLIIASGDHAR